MTDPGQEAEAIVIQAYGQLLADNWNEVAAEFGEPPISPARALEQTRDFEESEAFRTRIMTELTQLTERAHDMITRPGNYADPSGETHPTGPTAHLHDQKAIRAGEHMLESIRRYRDRHGFQAP